MVKVTRGLELQQLDGGFGKPTSKSRGSNMITENVLL